jgi:hypothetical protein
MWYNKITNELQSYQPWGNSWLALELIQQFYGDWEQVSDDFIPATGNGNLNVDSNN